MMQIVDRVVANVDNNINTKKQGKKEIHSTHITIKHYKNS